MENKAGAAGWEIDAELVVDCDAQLGEGPAWDEARGRLLFVDVDANRVCELGPEDGGWKLSTWEVGGPVSAVVPREAGGYVLAVRGGFQLLDAEQRLEETIAVGDERADHRMNDAKVDPQGRLWGGSMSTRVEPGRGALYRLDQDRKVERVLEGLDLPNGLDWSPDGETFYFIDTLSRGVDAFDFDGERGEISRRRRLLTFPPELQSMPDGMAVDVQGGLWVAAPIDGKILRYSPQGELLGAVRAPVTEVTSCAFGSSDGADLWITSSKMITAEFIDLFGFEPGLLDRVASERYRGGIFRCRPGVTGPPARPFAG